MQNKPWYTLDIDVNNAINLAFDFEQLEQEALELRPVTSDYWQFSLVDPPPNAWTWGFPVAQLHKVLNRDWVVKTQYRLKIKFELCLIFLKTEKFIVGGAHVDDNYFGNKDPVCYSAINWCPNPDDDAEMIWLDAPSENWVTKLVEDREKTVRYVPTPYEDEVGSYPIYSKIIGQQATLINTGMPHYIKVKSPKNRWAISIRYRNDPWDQIVQKLNPFIIE